MTTLLHSHSEGGSFFLHLLEEVVWHGLLDTLKLIPFLFLTYLLMEFIEHRASDKTASLIKKAGSLGPLAGGAVGIVPQCGFSAAAASLYTGRVITLGTLIAIFLSTSDEMLPILISGSVPVGKVMIILGYKAAVGIVIGFAIDIVLRLLKRNSNDIDIDAICENDGCHCERGIFRSALHHTLTISIFILIMTLLINTAVFFIGDERLSALFYDKPFVSHLVASILGLIPNCAVSVALSTFCTQGFITVGTMISGLLSGAGIGVLVLFRVNRCKRENFIIVGILVISGLVFGMLADLILPAIV